MTRRRGTKTTRRPEVKRLPWGAKGWTDAPNSDRPTATAPSPWGDIEAFLHALLIDKRIHGLTGGGGAWEVWLESGRVLRVVADEASAEEIAILR